MREFAFTIEYEPGVNDVMDVFIEHPRLVAATVDCAVSTERTWRVDRITGPAAGLGALDEVYLDPHHCNECIGEGGRCGTVWDHEVLSRTPNGRTVYSSLDQPSYCHSIPFLSARHLGDGLLFDAKRREARYEWRILVPAAEGIGELYDAIQGWLHEQVTVTLRQLREPTGWSTAAVTIADLPHEQREALETAVAAGYYDTPRGATLADLASRLDVPQSTFRYRLRRAEAWVTERFATAHSLVDDVEPEGLSTEVV